MFRKPHDVDILIRGSDHLDLTRELLYSLRQWTPAPSYHITYVDNGSPRAALQNLMSHDPDCTYVSLPFNHGSVRAINIGLSLALLNDAPYIVLLDNDTQIPAGDTEWLARFVAHLKGNVAAAGAVTDYAAGLQNCELNSDTYTIDWQDREGDSGKAGPYKAAALVSFALALRKDAVRKVGLFDELYEPGNFEDYDYSVQLRQAGYECVVAQDVWVHHKGSQTFKTLNFEQLYFENGRKFVEKWGADTLRVLGIQAVTQ